jgi:regulator of sigma E protease
MKPLKFLTYTSAFAVAGASMSKGAGIPGSFLMIGALIFLHEMGHFLFAKRMGIPVEVFSLGFGPRLCGFKWRETDVRLSIFPMGGYVRLLGYNPEEPEAKDPHGFLNQPYPPRMLFYSGGILANLLTAFVLLWAVGVDRSRVTSAAPTPAPLQVYEVAPKFPAAMAGILPGDLIRQVGDLHFPGATNTQAVSFIQAHPGQPIPVTLERAGQAQHLLVTPKDEGGSGRLGIMFQPTKLILTRRPLALKDFWTGSLSGLRTLRSSTVLVLQGYGRLVSCRSSIKEIGGPIAIIKEGSSAVQQGWATFCLFMAFISVNLAVLNAIPIPFLDGGHMVMLTIEKLMGKDLPAEIKERVLTGGFIFMVALMGFVFALDLMRLRG